MGGIKAVLVANPNDVTVSPNANAGVVTIAAATPGDKPFFRWDVAPGQNTFTSEAQISEAGKRYISTDLGVVLNGFDSGSAGGAILSRLTRILFIVEGKNGEAYLFGLINTGGDIMPPTTPQKARGADVTGFSTTQGQATADAVKATVSAHADSFILPLRVSGYSNLVND